MQNRTIDRLARKLIPSGAILGRQGWIMKPLGLLDRAASIAFPEYRSLPPAHLRVRIGVNNRIIFNQPFYIETGFKFWLPYFANGMMKFDASVVDIGCGCGRTAHPLNEYTFAGERFRGTYTGIDVDREMIDWCRQHFPADRFRFEWADTQSAVYNPHGQKTPYRVPLPDASQDFVFSQSLFTHLLHEDMGNYVRESARILKPGGAMAMTAFVLEDMEDKNLIGERWTFPCEIGPARAQDRQYPEAAVAYRREYLREIVRSAGFSSVTIRPLARQSVIEATI